jgi:AcrR family transcriptional regulator
MSSFLPDILVPDDSELPPSALGYAQQAPNLPYPNPPYRFLARNEHERIQIAVAHAVAERGYKTVTVKDICAAGDFSLRAFRGHFQGKREAVVDTLEAGADRRMTCCREAFETASAWPESIWAALGAYTEWMADNPDFGYLGLVEILAMGPTGRTLLRSLLDAFAIFLTPGYEFAPADAREAQVVEETVAESVFSLLHAHVLQEAPQTLPRILPQLTHAVLSPFLGAEAADAFVAGKLSAEQ